VPFRRKRVGLILATARPQKAHGWTGATASGSMIRSTGEASVMGEKSLGEAGAVSFGERFASSQAFTALFREGMALVEETASYLDGDGRAEAKALQRHAALAYATESMRLTTRLMQLASWLLLHRAVNEGEMSLVQARKEKAKVRVWSDEHGDDESRRLLPERLRELIDRSLDIQGRVRRLDSTIHSSGGAAVSNPVERQMGLLRAAFDTGRA
jgi:regulator of CtrA degradation